MSAPITITSESQLCTAGARPALRYQLQDPEFTTAPREREIVFALDFFARFATPSTAKVRGQDGVVIGHDAVGLAEKMGLWARWQFKRRTLFISPGAVAVAALRVGYPVLCPERGSTEVRIAVNVKRLPAACYAPPREPELEEMSASDLAHEARHVVGLS